MTFADTPGRMPALFVGHGSPMNAIEDNAYSLAWQAAGKALPRPQAILCISAHWQTSGTQVTAMLQPRTIYDFYGFPRPLYEKRYPAPGSPELAGLVQHILHSKQVEPDQQWGLDHGAWSVLCRMFPQADIPVVQLSLDYTQPPQAHYALARELKDLRRQGVLILGSGNIVHNLRLINWEGGAYDWAVAFDEWAKQCILAGDHPALANYPAMGPAARLAVPTNEHYLPLLYVLAVQEENEPVGFFTDQVMMGSLSMRCVQIG
jgi:4,5-DOPA dioxygenase extradiol